MAQNEQREDNLRQELEDFKKEKERVRSVLGRIGGKSHAKIDMGINMVILGIVVGLFALEFITGWIPTLLALEISVLLVSVKIVWMIHANSRSYHFQFWVLNSIEFRINEMTKSVRRLEKRLDTIEQAAADYTENAAPSSNGSSNSSTNGSESETAAEEPSGSSARGR
jgi:hypothetical protein